MSSVTVISTISSRVIQGINSIITAIEKIIDFFRQFSATIITFFNYFIDVFENFSNNIPVLAEFLDIFKMLIPAIMILYIAIESIKTIIS
jgi:phage-related minor tail protein